MKRLSSMCGLASISAVANFFTIISTLVPEEDPVEGWNMLYKETIKQNLNVSVIGGCDCKNLTFYKNEANPNLNFYSPHTLGAHTVWLVNTIAQFLSWTKYNLNVPNWTYLHSDKYNWVELVLIQLKYYFY
jgi:hypothetical protein